MQQTQIKSNSTPREAEALVEPQINDQSELLAETDSVLTDVDQAISDGSSSNDEALVESARNQKTEVVHGTTSARAWSLGGNVD